MKYIFFLFIMFCNISNDFYAQNTLKRIKGQALLVRLQTNEHLINYYTENNMIYEAKIAKEKQDKRNNKIIQTFQKTWSLCPVYFFYSNSYHEIKINNFKNVFDSNYKAVKTKNLDNLKNNFFIVYIGDTNGPLKFNALVLTDQYLKKLPHPYPRYVRTYEGLWFLKRKLSKSIQILEKKLDFQLSRVK